MNYKQKLSYTVLGAVIMLVGLGLGAIVAPPLIAQDTRVFDEIVCSGLTVLNPKGEAAFILTSDGEKNTLGAFNPKGKPAIALISDGENNSLSLATPAGQLGFLVNTSTTETNLALYQAGKLSIALRADSVFRFIKLLNEEENTLINLTADNVGARLIQLNNPKGDTAVQLQSLVSGFGNDLILYDKSGNEIWRASSK